MEVGTVETEPLSASVLGLGSSVGLWRLLPTMQHPITRHPATATPLLQPYPPLGTGVIPTSNITHMCPIAQLHGGRYSSKVQTPTESDNATGAWDAVAQLHNANVLQMVIASRSSKASKTEPNNKAVWSLLIRAISTSPALPPR